MAPKTKKKQWKRTHKAQGFDCGMWDFIIITELIDLIHEFEMPIDSNVHKFRKPESMDPDCLLDAGFGSAGNPITVLLKHILFFFFCLFVICYYLVFLFATNKQKKKLAF